MRLHIIAAVFLAPLALWGAYPVRAAPLAAVTPVVACEA